MRKWSSLWSRHGKRNGVFSRILAVTRSHLYGVTRFATARVRARRGRKFPGTPSIEVSTAGCAGSIRGAVDELERGVSSASVDRLARRDHVERRGDGRTPAHGGGYPHLDRPLSASSEGT